jgi:hypothetical protein
MSAWPFSDPPNVASFTVRDIVQKRKPILRVCRDNEDGTWQFLTGEPIDMADAMLVALKELVELDPSLLELADLPMGWQASRERQQSAWTRSQMDPDDA